MDRFLATLQLPFEHNKIEKMMEITGIALSPGVYTGIDGKTVEYDEKVIQQIVDTLPGKTILYAHTKEEDGEELKYISIGFFPESWKDEKRAMYRGYLYNPIIFPLVENKALDSGSLELDVKAEFDEGRDLYVARTIQAEAFTLTDRPAYKGARILSHNYVTQVKLEAWPGIKKTGLQKEKGGKRMDEEKEVEQLAAGYPKPESTPWGDLSDKEKFQTCNVFFKNQGYGMPVKKEDSDKAKQEQQEFVQAMAEALGVDLSKYTDWIKKCVEGGKTMKECATMWKEKYPSPEGEKAKGEMTTLSKRLELFEKEKLEALVGDIKKFDKKFEEKKLLEGLDSFDQKRAILERYLSYLEEHSKIKLSIGETDTDLKAQLEARRKTLAKDHLSTELYSMLYPEVK